MTRSLALLLAAVLMLAFIGIRPGMLKFVKP